MKAAINWINNVHFEGSTPDGHKVAIDGPPDSGGTDQGMRPMELLLLGVGACSSYDVVTILKKSRQAVSDCRCEIDGTRAETIPKVFTDIHLHFVVSGENLSSKQVERAIKLSAEKYCSASIMLSQAANITHDFEIIAT